MKLHPRISERATEPRYSIAEGALLVDRPASTIRRWAIGNTRKRKGAPSRADQAIRDEPLILVDGGVQGPFPLSFLNLLELRFLASYRSKAPLQSIRRALDFAAVELHEGRPLVSRQFMVRGKSLFLRFAAEGGEAYLMNASQGGQLAWPSEFENSNTDELTLRAAQWWPSSLDAFMSSVDYDQEDRAFRWWPLGRDEPVIVDTYVNGGIPSTARSGVRRCTSGHRGEGFGISEIAVDVGASEYEVLAALRFERVAS